MLVTECLPVFAAKRRPHSISLPCYSPDAIGQAGSRGAGVDGQNVAGYSSPVTTGDGLVRRVD
jgi:hypothetical protein